MPWKNLFKFTPSKRAAKDGRDQKQFAVTCGRCDFYDAGRKRCNHPSMGEIYALPPDGVPNCPHFHDYQR